MKALIISNDEFIISQSSRILKENGFDIIIYKWLLKALDNIEEIHPDLIFVSASEYPRHWKTLVQFVSSGIGGDKVALYLYETSALSDDDHKKSEALGINAILSSFNYDETQKLNSSIKEFFNIEEKSVIDIVEKQIESEVDEVKTGTVIFTNPETQVVNCGQVLSFNHNKLECVFDYGFDDLANNDIINQVTYFNGKECSSFPAEIFILNENTNSAILTIN